MRTLVSFFPRAVISLIGVYVADTNNSVVREILAPSGVIITVAGTPQQFGYTGDGGPATAAQLSGPEGVALDDAGNLYIADTGNSVIRIVSGGTINTLAGNGIAGYAGDNGGGLAPPPAAACNNPATCSIGNQPMVGAEFNNPEGVAVDSGGNVYVADTYNSIIRRIDALTGIITTVAGTPQQFGYYGDGGLAGNALLNYPAAVGLDASGNLYIADNQNNAIRELQAGTQMINTVAGLPAAGAGAGYSGDGGAATNALLNSPNGVTLDAAGNIYIADSLNGVVRKVEWATGLIATIAGIPGPPPGQPPSGGNYGDGGPATAALAGVPVGVALDVNGNLYMSDAQDSVIRKVGPQGALQFASMAAGSVSSPQMIAAANIGNASVDFDTANPYSVSAGFTVLMSCDPTQPVAPGASCYYSVADAPTGGSSSTGSLQLNDDAINASQSALLDGSGTKAASSTVLTTTVGQISQGQSLTLTAVASGGSAIPGGTVLFLDGAATLGAATLDGTGTATYSTASLSAGIHSLSAQYLGNAAYLGSVSASVQQFVICVACAPGATQLAFSTPPQSISTQTCSATAQIVTENPAGQITPVPSDTIVLITPVPVGSMLLLSPPPPTIYAGAGCAGSPTDKVKIAALSSSAQFSFSGTSGQFTFTISAALPVTLQSASQIETLIPTYNARTDFGAVSENPPSLCSFTPPQYTCTMSSSDLSPNVVYYRVTDPLLFNNGVRYSGEFYPYATAQNDWSSDDSTFITVSDGGGTIPIVLNANPAGTAAAPAPVACTAADPDPNCSCVDAPTCQNGVGVLNLIGQGRDSGCIGQTCGNELTGNGGFTYSNTQANVGYLLDGYYDASDNITIALYTVNLNPTINNPNVPVSFSAPITGLWGAEATCPNLAGFLPTTWTNGAYLLTLAGDDSRVATAIGGEQDYYSVVWVYDQNLRACRYLYLGSPYLGLPMQTGGGWGPTGQVTAYDDTGLPIAAPYYPFTTGYPCDLEPESPSCLHGASMTPDGKYAIFGGHGHESDYWGPPSAEPYPAIAVWEIDTNNVYECNPLTGVCGGHGVLGYNGIFDFTHDTFSFVNVHFLPFPQNAPAFDNTKLYPDTTPPLPSTGTGANQQYFSWDEHVNWNNNEGQNIAPFVLTTISIQSSYTNPIEAWGDELLLGYGFGASTMYRIAQTYNRPYANGNYGDEGLAEISHNGKWATFGSGWALQDVNPGTCTDNGVPGPCYRADQFLVSLPLATNASKFIVAPAQTALTVLPGQSNTTEIITTATGALNSPVFLSATIKAPPNAMVNGHLRVLFNPPQVPAAGGSVLITVTADEQVTPGNYPITITGSAPGSATVPGQTWNTTVYVTVPYFQLVADQPNVYVNNGASQASFIRRQFYGGLSCDVMLETYPNPPSGLTVTFNPNPIPASSTTGTSTMTTGSASGCTSAQGDHFNSGCDNTIEIAGYCTSTGLSSLNMEYPAESYVTTNPTGTELSIPPTEWPSIGAGQPLTLNATVSTVNGAVPQDYTDAGKVTFCDDSAGTLLGSVGLQGNSGMVRLLLPDGLSSFGFHNIRAVYTDEPGEALNCFGATPLCGTVGRVQYGSGVYACSTGGEVTECVGQLVNGNCGAD